MTTSLKGGDIGARRVPVNDARQFGRALDAEIATDPFGQQRRRHPSIVGRGDRRQRAPRDVVSAPFIAEGRPPASGARFLSPCVHPVSDRARPGDDDDARLPAGRPIERDLGIGRQHDVLHLLGIARAVGQALDKRSQERFPHTPIMRGMGDPRQADSQRAEIRGHESGLAAGILKSLQDGDDGRLHTDAQKIRGTGMSFSEDRQSLIGDEGRRFRPPTIDAGEEHRSSLGHRLRLASSEGVR